MTREEALKKLADIIFNAAKSGYMPYDTNDELCAMSIAKKHIDDFYTSLPSNLDEAAEEQWAAMEYVSNTARESTSVRDWCTNDIVDAFKAGADFGAKKMLTKLKENCVIINKDLYEIAMEGKFIEGKEEGEKWMAEQFQKIEGELVDWYETKDVDYCYGIKTEDAFEVPEGFYIRKK